MIDDVSLHYVAFNFGLTVWFVRVYGVVPKGLFKVTKTTFGTLVYRSERQIAGKK